MRFSVICFFLIISSILGEESKPIDNEKDLKLLNSYIGSFFSDLSIATAKDINRLNKQTDEISQKISKLEKDYENKKRVYKILNNKERSPLSDNGPGTNKLQTELKQINDKLNVHKTGQDSIIKNKKDMIDYYNRNIERTDNKEEVSKIIIQGMYNFYSATSPLLQELDSEAASLVVINNFITKTEQMNWIKKVEEKDDKLPLTEEEFLLKFGSKITSSTKFTSIHGSSNTYWIGNICINYSNGKIYSVFQSNN